MVGYRHCWTHVLFYGIGSVVCPNGDGVLDSLNVSPKGYCNGWIWIGKVNGEANIFIYLFWTSSKFCYFHCSDRNGHLCFNDFFF